MKKIDTPGLLNRIVVMALLLASVVYHIQQGFSNKKKVSEWKPQPNMLRKAFYSTVLPASTFPFAFFQNKI